jgi:diadenosine tetraphosphate (Ap4A) HIT family hydrolase
MRPVTVADCHLCGQIAGDPRRDLIARLLAGTPYVRRVVADSDAFAVIPSLGALADGHLLLCPRPHLRRMADASIATHAEYDEVRRRLVRALTQTYGGAIHVFEHGMACAEGSTLCTVDHAHVHFVPLPDHLPPVALRDGEWRAFDGRLATLAALTGGRAYLSYEPPGRTPLVAVDPDSRFESQYMRRRIADAIGAAEWNWRSAPDAAATHRTWLQCTAAMAAAP